MYVNPDWVDESLNPQFAGSVKPVKNEPRKALCSFCLKTISLSNMGKQALVTWIVRSIKNLALLLALNIHCVKKVQIRSFFWSLFSCIRTKYGDLRSKSLYSVRIQENSGQKKLRIWTLHTVISDHFKSPEFKHP